MNGEGKLRTELIKTGIPSYEWPSSDGQVKTTSPCFAPAALGGVTWENRTVSDPYSCAKAPRRIGG